MKIYTDSDFIPALNSEFVVKMIETPEYRFGYDGIPNEKLKITLKKVAEIPFSGFRSPVRDLAFILKFAADRELPQGTYHLDHDIIGNLEVFLVAHGPGEDGFQLTATFS